MCKDFCSAIFRMKIRFSRIDGNICNARDTSAHMPEIVSSAVSQSREKNNSKTSVKNVKKNGLTCPS